MSSKKTQSPEEQIKDLADRCTELNEAIVTQHCLSLIEECAKTARVKLFKVSEIMMQARAPNLIAPDSREAQITLLQAQGHLKGAPVPTTGQKLAAAADKMYKDAMAEIHNVGVLYERLMATLNGPEEPAAPEAKEPAGPKLVTA